MTSTNGPTSSDSVDLGSNPGSPATTNADVSGVSADLTGAEKSEQPEQTAHTGRTETGTAPAEHDYADDLDDEEGDGDDWLDQECHLGRDGQCGLAGTEHCDFECPYRDSEDFAGSDAWNKKHAAAPPRSRMGGAK